MARISLGAAVGITKISVKQRSLLECLAKAVPIPGKAGVDQRLEKYRELGFASKVELCTAQNLLVEMSRNGGIGNRIEAFNCALDTPLKIPVSQHDICLEVLNPFNRVMRTLAEGRMEKRLDVKSLAAVISAALWENADCEDISRIASRAGQLNRFPGEFEQLRELKSVELHPFALKRAFNKAQVLLRQLQKDFPDMIWLKSILFSAGKFIYCDHQIAAYTAAMLLR